MSIVLASKNFFKGYMSDIPRDQLAPGFAYRMKDWIPRLGGVTRKRGGWTNGSKDLSSVAACANVSGLAWAPFPDDPHLVVVSDNGNLYNVKKFDGTDGSFIASLGFSALTHAPIWHTDLSGIVILQGLGASPAAPYKYVNSGGYTATALGGSPPQATVGASWGDYLLLANGYVSGIRYENRIWISGVGEPETWDTGNAFWDMKDEIVRIIPLRLGLLVFGYTDTWLLTGDTPPPGGNWAEQDVFHGNGCMDGRSLVLYREFAVWANNTGVYKADGYTLDDLTADGGIKQRWAELVGDFDFKAGWSCSAGIYNGHYIIVVFDAGGNFVTCQVCDLENGPAWYEFTNLEAAMFAYRASGPGTATVDGSEELFFAHRSHPYVGRTSSCWNPSSSNASDGDGNAVLPQIETPFWKPGGPGRKQIRRGWATYDIRSAGASPYLGIEYVTSPEEGAPYTAISDTLTTTTEQNRRGFQLRQRDLGIGLRITQVGASADTRLAEIELDVNTLEPMR